MDSQEPVSFPLFTLRDVEFLRLNGTEFHVVVDSQSIVLAPFPVPLPMQGQRRSFSKYSEHADLMEVFPAGIDQLPRIAIAEGTDVHREGPTAYLFAGDALERIAVGETEVVNRFTTFGTWPKKYSYRAEIDLQPGANAAAWHNASADATGSDATE
ncbi:hypothetical protein [Brachybacterium sp. Marseille-Q7125]|uniref:hypothetical protein n=1 Tax=Brachybacterium sp. Marseille-Q7125 TaxID=2932815 RepID=UPI001FF5D7E0|nr:hypothetical protein [Brachybacterium sp. Marseille-Q7125]